MSASAEGSTSTTKAVVPDTKPDSTTQGAEKPTPALEEDDEFEDFPVEDWPQEDAEVPGGNAHLWEESWDDDDTSEEFSKQLKEELKKIKSNK